MPSRNRGIRKWLWRCTFYMSATQHSNVCHRTAMADTQLLEHSGGSGLDHDNRLLWRVPRVCELCLSVVVVVSIAGNHVLWRLSPSGKLDRIKNRSASCLFFGFFFVFFFSVGLNLLFCARKSLFVYFVFFCFFCSSLGPRPLGCFLSASDFEL